MNENEPQGRMEVRTRDYWTTDLGGVEGGTLRAIVGVEFDDRARSLRMLEMGPGAATTNWCHPGEAAYYVISGSASVTDVAADRVLEISAGHAVHVDERVVYRFMSDGDGVALLGGPCPSSPAHHFAEPRTFDRQREGVRLFHRDQPGIRIPLISRDARMLVWIGVDARTANMNYVVLEPGERNMEHVHRYSEDTIYILSGHGAAEDLTNDVVMPIGPGDTVQIPPGVWHAVAADPDEQLVSVGGPCPADLDLLAAAGLDVTLWTKAAGGSS